MAKENKGRGNPAWYKGMPAPHNAGRPPGAKSKKTVALRALFEIMTKTENITRFKKELQKNFDKDPLAFYERFIRPVEPKDVNLLVDNTEPDLTKIKMQGTLNSLSDGELMALKALLGKLNNGQTEQKRLGDASHP